MPTHALVNNGNTDIIVAVYQRKITLTDAEIKTLPTVPIELLPAVGESKILILHSAMLSLDESAGQYTGLLTATGQFCHINVFYGTTQEEANDGNSVASNYINEKWLPMFGYGQSSCLLIPQTQTDDLGNSVGYPVPTASWNNKSLSLTMMNAAEAGAAGSNLTGGNAANTLKVTVFYSIVDL